MYPSPLKFQTRVVSIHQELDKQKRALESTADQGRGVLNLMVVATYICEDSVIASVFCRISNSPFGARVYGDCYVCLKEG